MRHIRALSLDLDDTLWEISPVIRRAELALRDWLAAHYPVIVERFSPEDMVEVRREVMERHHDRVHDLRFIRKAVLRHVAADAGYDEAIAEPAFDVFDRERNSVDLYPEVLGELERLSERYTVIAVTNGNANLETIGIRHLFDGVVTAEEAGAAKPAMPIFDVAIRMAGVGAGEILHVGDHPETDIHGARQAGLCTAWINRRREQWPERFEAPDVEVTSMTELRELLEMPE